MRDEQFKKTEKQLYNYYEYVKELKVIDNELELLDEQYNYLENKLRNNQYTLEEESSSPSFDERVQTSGDGASYAENQMIKFAQECIKEQRYIIKKIFKLDQRKRLINRNIIRLKSNIEMLNDEYKKFIELKYRDKKDINIIASELNISERNTFRLRKDIVEDIGRWGHISNYC